MFWDFIILALILVGIGLFGRIFFNMALIATIFMFLFAGLVIIIAFFFLTMSLALM
ncbi:MAG: hypothetical protein IJ471_00235 [Eubacterium sp.]|nr:hypothetical protein [Eubacterium sp.]